MGWPEAAPFDRIIVTCASPSRPDHLLTQLKPGGIMIAPVDHQDGRDGQDMVKYTIDNQGNITETILFDVRFVPLISEE